MTYQLILCLKGFKVIVLILEVDGRFIVFLNMSCSDVMCRVCLTKEPCHLLATGRSCILAVRKNPSLELSRVGCLMFFFCGQMCCVQLWRAKRTYELLMCIGEGDVYIHFMEWRSLIMWCRGGFVKVVFFLPSHVGMFGMEYVGKGYFLEQLTLIRYAYFTCQEESVSSCLELVG